MVEVLVLYYTRGGRTEALAKAVVEGVNRVDGASAKAAVKRTEAPKD